MKDFKMVERVARAMDPWSFTEGKTVCNCTSCRQERAVQCEASLQRAEELIDALEADGIIVTFTDQPFVVQ